LLLERNSTVASLPQIFCGLNPSGVMHADVDMMLCPAHVVALRGLLKKTGRCR